MKSNLMHHCIPFSSPWKHDSRKVLAVIVCVFKNSLDNRLEVAIRIKDEGELYELQGQPKPAFILHDSIWIFKVLMLAVAGRQLSKLWIKSCYIVVTRDIMTLIKLSSTHIKLLLKILQQLLDLWVCFHHSTQWRL